MKIIKTQLKINLKQNQLKIKHNRKPICQNTNQPKTQACCRHERECVSVLSQGSLVERFFFKFEESTNLIEKERGRKRNNFFF